MLRLSMYVVVVGDALFPPGDGNGPSDYRMLGCLSSITLGVAKAVPMQRIHGISNSIRVKLKWGVVTETNKYGGYLPVRG